MKKLLFSSLCIAALMTACNSEEPVLTPDQNLVDGSTQYMVVNIKSASETAPITRADDPDYEDGEDFESKVSTVDFYFFDKNGEPVNVKAGNTNHLPSTDIEMLPGEAPNVTSTVKAVLVISTEEGDQIPSQILAVVNDETDYKNLSVEALQDKLTDGRTGDDFVMTNSVHLEGGNMMIATPVAGHLFNDKDKALADPVTIYVERTLGKVRLTTSLTPVEGKELTFNPNKLDESGAVVKEQTYNNKQIYVKFLGWNVTTTSKNNRLVKKIHSDWTSDWVWNLADYHRSFWAINAPDNDYLNYDFEKDGKLAADAITNFNGGYTYLKENAGRNSNNGFLDTPSPSQVIIAAQLVDENGDPMEFAEWAGQRMTKDALKIALADALSLYSGDYVEGQKFVRTKIKPEQLELVTATQSHNGETRRYLVFAQLTNSAAKEYWYKDTDKSSKKLSPTELTATFKALGGAKVWTEGKTYYYHNIRHLNPNPDSNKFGVYGVVRIHVYACDLTKLTGLGTPVYDPDEVIIPEKPQDDDTFIAAEIKVLSWRIVNNNVELDW